MCIDSRRKTNTYKVMKANETPIQFKDKIDEYLWKEHHIIYGCCSSVESLKYAVAREVAEKLTDAFIEKAAEFLYNYNQKQVLKHGARATLGCGEYTINVDEFRKYMKGE